MGRLLPFETETRAKPDDPQVLDLEDEATAEALSALSSETAREILAALYEDPQTPPDVRDEVGTSLQNVHYHLERLEDADLIQPAGSGYSEKGTEMTVYAPKSEAVVLFAGQQHHRSRLKTALGRLLGAVGILGLAALAINRFFGGRRVPETGGGGAATDGDGAGDSGASGEAGGGDSAGGDGGDAGGAGGGDELATEEASPEASLTPEPEPTPTATDTGGMGIMEETSTPTPAAEPTATPRPTPEPTPTPQATSEPMATPTATPEPVETDAPSPTPEPAGTPTPTAEPTPTPAPEPTPAFDAGTPAAEAGTSAAGTPTPVGTTRAADGVTELAGSAGAGLDPALAFFFGGLFMLVLVGAWSYWRGR
jgi:DNA-binding transcriptional ArsR family regulator